MTSLSPTPESLRSHAEWVRSLARSMVSDPHLADDLAQETWVSALQCRSPVGNLRGWLSQVLRNLVRQDRRAAGRRTRLERASARPEREPPTAELVERVTSHRAVVEAVLELDEPYRSAVLLRFFDNLPPRRIAQRLGVPVSTVHTRIQRGLKMLRARLDHLRGGPRGSWRLAVLPLIHNPGGAAATVLGALYMKTKLQILFGVLVVALGLVAAWPLLGDTGAAPAGSSGRDPLATGTPAAVPGSPAQSEALAREAVADPEPGTAAAATPNARFTVAGRLVDSEARPLGGMGLQLSGQGDAPGAAVATSGPAGEFEIQGGGEAGRLTVVQDGWTTVMAAQINPRSPPTHALVVAARSIVLAGRVVDEFGVPVPDAQVEVALPEGFRTRFTENSDAAAPVAWRDRAAGDGRFELTEAASIPGASLVCASPGYDEDRRPLPLRGDASLEIVLRRTARAEDTVFGQVIDPRGAVVAGAWVGIGGSSTRSDDQGSFTLKLAAEGPIGQIMDELGEGHRILAVKEGYRPARLERPRDSAGRFLDWPRDVVLRLGEAPLSIAGRVVDAAGEPVEGVRVWVNDPTVFGRADRTLVTLENVMAGSDDRWDFTRTDQGGRFELGGLSERDYRLRAMVDDTLLMVDSDPIPAGTQDALIPIPAAAYFEKVAGRVVSAAGMPVAGVAVIPQADPFRLQIGGETVSTNHANGEVTFTGEAGRFELGGLPRANVYLRLQGEQILPLEYGRGVEGGIEALSGGAVEDLLITVSVRVHVQVELDDPDSADRIRVLDIEGRELPINVFAGNSRNTVRSLELVDGRTPVIVLPDNADRMVFLKDGEEVRSVGLGLIPGEVNRIRW